MANKDFDKHIKDQLQDWQVEYDPSSWEALNDKLNLEPNLGDSFEDGASFDQGIKEQMQNLKLDYDPNSWNALNDKLNEALGFDDSSEADHNFDEDIASKLRGEHAAYNSQDWEKLNDKLNEKDQLADRLVKVALFQFAFVFLLLLSLWNWKGAEIIHDRQERKEQESLLQYAFAQQKEDFYDQFLFDLENRNHFSQPAYALLNVSESKRPLTKKSMEPVVPDFEESTLELLTKYSTDNIQSNSKVLASTPLEDITQIVFATVKEEINSLTPIAALSSLDVSLLENDQMVDIDDTILISFDNQSKPKIRYSASGQFSPDLYLIRSAEDPIYPLPSYFTDSYGLSGGALFSTRRNNLEVESGLLYSSVRYQPREITETYESLGQYYETHLEDIFFNVLAAPLQFKYHFDIGRKSSFYVLMGASFNMVINSNFNIDDIQVAQPLSPFADIQRNDPLLDQKEFDPGVFEGGNIFDNSFVTADIGFGFEQVVARRLSFYAQAKMNTQFSSGIGPNKDKLHKLSLGIGAKYQLNRI